MSRTFFIDMPANGEANFAITDDGGPIRQFVVKTVEFDRPNHRSATVIETLDIDKSNSQYLENDCTGEEHVTPTFLFEYPPNDEEDKNTVLVDVDFNGSGKVCVTVSW